MHVAFDRRHDDPPGRCGASFAALLFDVGSQHRDGAFHHAGALDHLRQEHLSAAEQFADPVHAVHQRPFDHGQRIAQRPVGFFGVFVDKIGDSFQHGVRQPFADTPFAPL